MLDPEAAAAFTAQRAATDPLALAEENATLRSAVQGAYAILYVLVEQAGGDVTIAAEQYQNVPAHRLVKVDDSALDGTVRIRIEPR